ncbi:ABC transporter [Xylariaceae sp. FL1651]|nr:ABC transporter [Xylariaceae sp. FL1651]
MGIRLCPSDSTFGPAVSNCRGGFDFTIEFEDIVLSLVPSSLFLVLAIVRLRYFYLKKPIFTGSIFGNVKLITAAAYSAIQLSVLIKIVQLSNENYLTTAARAVSFASSVLVLPLTILEDRRSQRPSFLLIAFLFITVLFDIVQVRTRWLIYNNFGQIVLARLYTAEVAVKFTLLILESQKKKTTLGRSPEETAGPLSLATYMWLNSLFLKGYRNVLSLADLPSLEKRILSENLHEKLSIQLLPARLSQSSPSFGLTKALVRTLLGPLLFGILPRLALVGFRFSQPLLLNRLLNHLGTRSDEELSQKNIGYGLIGATAFVYFGLAFSTALYWYCHERFISMTRGALVAAIYEKLTRLSPIYINDSAAVTLMSTDIERIRVGFLNLHEFWASCVEVALASWLLYTQLSIAFVAPLIVVIISVTGASILNIYTGSRQRRWMERIQVRVTETAHMLSNIKQLKISGLSRPVEESTQQLRVDELDAASSFRRLYVSTMAFGFAPQALCPLITFAVTARNLDTSTIFTSLAYIVLLADPLGILFGEIPYLLTAFTCLGRIQEFLSQETQIDNRHFESPGTLPNDEKSEPSNHLLIRIDNARIGWAENTIVFQNASISIPMSCLTLIVGPVGCGKTTLCRALIGEIPFVYGSIAVSVTANQFKSALSDQTPYIHQGSVRDNIIGSLAFDNTRYKEVVSATLLDPDLKTLPQGDYTIVGSNGITLSGGQKQRVAMARALYHDANFYVFDDSLSGLDADTELELFSRVFGLEGVLARRKVTVVLATHSVKLLPLASHIISLGTRGTVDYEGDYSGLVATGIDQQNEDMLKYFKAEQELDQLSIQYRKSSEADANEISDTIGVATHDSFLSEKDRMAGDSTVYRYYLASLGKLSIAAFMVFGLGWGFFYNFGSIWLEFWSADTRQHHSKGFYIGLYAVWQTGGLLSIVLCFWMSYTMMVRISGAILHQSALRTVVHAPLSFITTTDVGVVTNLFSQDMTLIDNELPMAVTNLALDIFNALGMAAVIATSSPYLVILYPFLAAALYLLQKIYLRTARQLRLLDLEAKSPLYTQFLDTSRGLATIRAFGWTRDRIRTALGLLDASQGPSYLLAMVQRWLQFVLQCVVALIAIMVVTLATQLHSHRAGFTGPSIVALMSFGDILNYIIRWWTQLETSVGAVTRIKSLSDIILPEGCHDETVESLPSEWPANGHIEIRDVSASYQNGDKPDQFPSASMAKKRTHLVLENISISIAAGEKVAICGRSGSGKSSMLLLLLRMLDPLPQCSRNIVIDDIGLQSVARADVRNRIIAISQDPVFLPGDVSIKRQLDPFNKSTEAECKAALQLVGLGDLATGVAGLEARLRPESLSGGQRQLFNLSRAVLRGRARSKGQYSSNKHNRNDKVGGILLLDEVSSSVDKETERTMQRIIMEEFDKYTIVMVAHHLDMVMEFDTILVMERGQVAEQGEPKTLVKQKGSYFCRLWMQHKNN